MFSLAWWISLGIGFLSLSEEILWVRILGFDFSGQAGAFSFVLALYLVGIAFGAAYGRRVCQRSTDLYGATSLILAIAALGDILIPTVIGKLIVPHDSLLVPALAITATAGIKSVLFPIVHHLGSDASGPRVGRSVSRIYFGNIIGATLGPLVTGFYALDHLSVDECFALVAASCLLLAAAAMSRSTARARVRPLLAIFTVSALVAAVTIRTGPGSMAQLAAEGPDAMIFYAANRHGIVHSAHALRGETVFGGNVYDGLPSVDVDLNLNRLDRIYLVGLVHPELKRMLFVGVSSGAWMRAAQGFPGVENIEAVEINPAYLELMRQRPAVAALLTDPKIQIHIDDGRRWLRRNPDRRYDAIVQNSTFHWRANTGNLLSREYFEMARQRLNPGGVFVTNTTGSFDVFATLQAVFPYTYRYANFAYASDRPLTPRLESLWSIRRPDGAFFDSTDKRPSSVVGRLAVPHWEPASEFLARHPNDARVITDDNLMSEYRHGIAFGPALIRLLQPPAPAKFSIDEP